MRPSRNHGNAKPTDVHNDRASSRRSLHQFHAALDAEELKPVSGPRRVTSVEENTIIPFVKHIRAGKHKDHSIQRLSTICAQFLARNIHALPVKYLAQLSWSHVKQIWAVVDEEMLDSLDVYVKFVSIFPEIKKKKTINTSLLELSSVLDRLINLPPRMSQELDGVALNEWLVSLDVSHMPVPQEVLLQFGTIPNLTVLKVNDTGIKDSTINHWHRSYAVGKFRQLRLLDIRANSGIRNPRASLGKLVQFVSLQWIRCDVSALPHDPTSSEPAAADLKCWEAIEQPNIARVCVIGHLGSRGDHRPSFIVQDVLLSVTSLTAALQESKESTTSTRAPALNAVSSKRKRKSMGRDINWKDMF